MAKKRAPERLSERYAGIPHAALDSVAYQGATMSARCLLMELARQHNGSNNGHLQLSQQYLFKRGWKSADTISRAKEELIRRRLVVLTRLGGFNIGASKFALTWHHISNFVGLEIKRGEYHPGLYLTFKESVTRKCQSDSRSGTNPISGWVDERAPPNIGPKTCASGEITNPIAGDNEIKPFPPKVGPPII
jgi:hypothetical protein